MTPLRALCALALAAPALAFTLARPTALSATPWDADTAPPLAPATRALGATPWTWEPLADTEAVCLDGSQYGLVTCIGAGPIKTTYINIQGGACRGGRERARGARARMRACARAAREARGARACVCGMKR